MASRVYEVQYIPGKGTRCRGKKGSFIKCPRKLKMGEIGEISDMGELGRTGKLSKTGKVGKTGKLSGSKTMGRVSSKVATKKFIKGKGLRCWDRKGKFTSCFAGTTTGKTGKVGRTSGMGKTGGSLGKTTKKRKSTTKRRVRVKGKGMRCRRPDGRFVKC